VPTNSEKGRASDPFFYALLVSAAAF
jgi:hypothetical protein